MTHTPLPWNVNRKNLSIWGGSPERKFALCKVWKGSPTEEERANADLIVSAVNSYEILIAQNEWLKDRLSNLQLPATSQKNIEEWLVECGMPSATA
jgi:hypothetical protein